MIANIWGVLVRRWRWMVIGGLVVGALVLIVRGRDAREPLPESVAQQVERHAVETMADTAEIHRLERVAESAGLKQESVVVRARGSEVVAVRRGTAADSLAKAAVVAPTVSDSALAWRKAYDARSSEAVSLGVATMLKDSALAATGLRATSLDRALVRSEARAERADSVIGAVVRVAGARREACRIVWVVPCPSRRVVMVGTAIATAVVVANKGVKIGVVRLQW